jgi:succinyl-CoA synthetase alpha subunit
VRETGADASVIYVPAAFAADGILEAADAGIKVIVCITEGIPVRDMINVKAAIARQRRGADRPQLPRHHHPGECKIGIMPGFIHQPGKVGIVSRSGTLTYEAVSDHPAGPGPEHLRRHRRRPDQGAGFHRLPEMFEADPQTEAIILVGEIGGSARGSGRRIHPRQREPNRWPATSPASPRRRASAWAMPAPSSPAAAGKIAALEDKIRREAGSKAGVRAGAWPDTSPEIAGRTGRQALPALKVIELFLAGPP